MHRKDIRNIASITAISISSETKTFFQLMKNTRPCSCMLFLHTVKISSHLLMCVALFGFHLPERRQMGSGAWIIEWQNQNKNTTITTMPFSLSSLSITADSIKAARTFGTKSQACQDRESFKLALGWHIISYMRLFLEMFFFFSTLHFCHWQPSKHVTKAQSLPIHSYFCADPQDFTILSVWHFLLNWYKWHFPRQLVNF